jgi:hypothetical protein
MTKFMRFIEVLLLPAIAVVSLVVSLGDVFNLFHLIPVSKLPMVILVIISIGLGTLAVILNKCNEMQSKLENLLSKAELEQMKEIITHINPNLRKVMGDGYFSGMFLALETAIKASKVQVNDSSSFRFNFKRMLKAFPRATFLSTSSLATSYLSYLWNDRDTEVALAHFIREGGKIKQIFFVRSPEEAASAEMQFTLDILKKIGITVRIVNSTRIPSSLKQYFIVESRGKIGWDIPVNHQGHVELSVITAATAVTANYCKMFETLWESAE